MPRTEAGMIRERDREQTAEGVPRSVSRALACQSARKRDPGSACKKDPLKRRKGVVQVANGRDPRASRSALTSDGAARVGGACLPTWATPGGGGPGAGWLIPTEAPGRFDRLEFVEVELVDGLQRFGCSAFLQAVG